MSSGPPGVGGACWRRSGPGGTVEKLTQLVGDVVRLVLGEEVACVDARAADVAGPRPPDVEDVAVQAGQRSADAPHNRQRAGDAALLLPIGIVVLAVDAGTGPVVLADGLDNSGIV